MLTPEQFKTLQAYVETNKRMGAQKVIDFIGEHFLNETITPSRDPNSTYTIFPNRNVSEHPDKTRQREIEQRFKVRTEAESKQGQKNDPFSTPSV